jgi:hypothetical protein
MRSWIHAAVLSLVVGLIHAIPIHDGLFHHMGKQIPRENFIRREKPQGHEMHKVVIAIRKKNLPELETMVIDRATPGTPQYQQWFSYDEITDIVKNPEATARVKSWLSENNIEIDWISNREDYIKVRAPLAKWEKLLDCEFYSYEDLSVTKNNEGKKPHIIYRASEYSIPVHLKDDIHAIFYTVQTPPEFHQRFRMKQEKTSDGRQPFKSVFRVDRNSNINAQSSSAVTVSFINSYYQVPTNIGDSRLNQSVFETANEFMSTDDLTSFQNNYGLTVQSAIGIGGYVAKTCNTEFMSCAEGNLDIQYIMGIAQKTASVYWYITDSGDTDPFVVWVTDMANQKNPPKSNSASWGALEYVSFHIASLFLLFDNNCFCCYCNLENGFYSCSSL